MLPEKTLIKGAYILAPFPFKKYYKRFDILLRLVHKNNEVYTAQQMADHTKLMDIPLVA